MRVEGLALTLAVHTDANPFSLTLEGKYELTDVLGLVGMELTFFIASCMAPLFGIWGWWFDYCWTSIAQLWDFLFFPCSAHPSPQSRVRGWEMTELGHLTWTGQRDSLYNTESCSAIKTGAVEEGKVCVCLPRWLLLLGWASICLWDLLYVCFCAAYFLPFFPSLMHLLNRLYLDPQVFLLLLFLVSPPFHGGGWKWPSSSVDAWLLAGARPPQLTRGKQQSTEINEWQVDWLH